MSSTEMAGAVPDFRGCAMFEFYQGDGGEPVVCGFSDDTRRCFSIVEEKLVPPETPDQSEESVPVVVSDDGELLSPAACLATPHADVITRRDHADFWSGIAGRLERNSGQDAANHTTGAKHLPAQTADTDGAEGDTMTDIDRLGRPVFTDDLPCARKDASTYIVTHEVNGQAVVATTQFVCTRTNPATGQPTCNAHVGLQPHPKRAGSYEPTHPLAADGESDPSAPCLTEDSVVEDGEVFDALTRALRRLGLDGSGA